MTRRPTAETDTAELERQLARSAALLRAGSLQQASEAGRLLLENFPESTSAHEFMGDVLHAQGDSAKARAHFKTAMELEPANADAERKFASALLNLSQSELDRRAAFELLEGDIPPPSRTPERSRNATVAALLFPGLGQLYNRQYAKGLVIFAAAAIGLMLLFNALIVTPWAQVTKEAADTPLSFSQQMQLVGVALTAMPVWYKLLLLTGLVGFLVVYTYCIYDAYTVAQNQSSRAGPRR